MTKNSTWYSSQTDTIMGEFWEEVFLPGLGDGSSRTHVLPYARSQVQELRFHLLAERLHKL